MTFFFGFFFVLFWLDTSEEQLEQRSRVFCVALHKAIYSWATLASFAAMHVTEVDYLARQRTLVVCCFSEKEFGSFLMCVIQFAKRTTILRKRESIFIIAKRFLSLVYSSGPDYKCTFLFCN